MAERTICGFKLTGAIVICPDCGAQFHKELLTDTPLLTADDIVEADMHRVFPDPVLRASLLGLCPECKYCGWSTAFGALTGAPTAPVKKEPLVPYTKKYAIAVKCARSQNIHPLDIAFMAINGLWCAREAGEEDQLWLELVAYEHSRGMEDELTLRDEDDGMAHLMMGEIWRQLRQFDKAKREYEMSLKDPATMPEIVRHQIGLCERKVASITALPLHIVRQLFPMQDEQEDQQEQLEQLIPELEDSLSLNTRSATSSTKALTTESTAGSVAPPVTATPTDPATSAAPALHATTTVPAVPAATSAPAVSATTYTSTIPAATSAPAVPATTYASAIPAAASAPAVATPPVTAPVSPASSPAELEDFAQTQQSTPKITAETAMLSAISSLLAAEAALLSTESSQVEPAPSAKAEPMPTTIRPARPRTTAAQQPQQNEERAADSDSNSKPTRSTATPPRHRQTESSEVAPTQALPKAVTAAMESMQQPNNQTPVRPMPGATPTKAVNTDPVHVAPATPAARVPGAPAVAQPATVQATAVAQPVAARQAAPEPAPTQSIPDAEPLLINIQGIERVHRGNLLPRLRHSHKFRHSGKGPLRMVRDGWMSDYPQAEVAIARTYNPATPVGIGTTTEYSEPAGYERASEHQGDPLPDFDIEDSTGSTTKSKKNVSNQASGTTTSKETRPAQEQQPQQQQSSDHSDAIARVESYLSFSRALHTRSFLKYN